jgi:excisionase family DNA binding protein
MPVAQEETYLTVKEIAKRYKVTEQTIRNYVKRGQLEAVRFGDQLRISEKALQDFLDKQNKK